MLCVLPFFAVSCFICVLPLRILHVLPPYCWCWLELEPLRSGVITDGAFCVNHGRDLRAKRTWLPSHLTTYGT